MNDLIMTACGHRPDRLGSYKIPNPTYDWICFETERILKILQPKLFYSGMALGYDQWCAEICIRLGVPFVAAVPFKGQESVWPKASQDKYHELLYKAIEVVIVSEGGYSAKKMQIRNEFMLSKANIVISAWNGLSGGTGNAMKFVFDQKKDWVRLDPDLKMITLSLNDPHANLGSSILGDK